MGRPVDLIVSCVCLVQSRWMIRLIFFVFLFVGTGDAMHMSEDAGEVGITGEVTVASPPPMPIAEASSSVGANTLSSEVADF